MWSTNGRLPFQDNCVVGRHFEGCTIPLDAQAIYSWISHVSFDLAIRSGMIPPCDSQGSDETSRVTHSKDLDNGSGMSPV